MSMTWRSWLNTTFRIVSNASSRKARKKRDKRAAARRKPPALQVEALETRVVPAGTWAPFTNAAPDPNGIGTMMLLTDGSIMAQGGGVTNAWYKLTPGADGSYANSGWASIAPMSLQRLYFGSNVLQDGRVLVVGGEYSGPNGNQNLTGTGEIYDPVANKWSSIANFPQGNFGDDPTMLLDNGQVLAGFIFSPQTWLYTPSTNKWTMTGFKMNGEASDEETWLKLPDGSVLNYDVFNDVDHGQSTAERYIPSTGQWVSAGTVPVDLSSSALGYELGGATMLPDGRAWYVGATGHTAFYTPSTNTWTAGPDLPNGQHADDAPLCMMPNGHVLLLADGSGGASASDIFGSPTHVYDYDPVANSFTEVDPPQLQGSNDQAAYYMRLLMLPDGNVALSDGSDQLWEYTPDSGQLASSAPTINAISDSNGTFTLTGTQLTGVSAGASYGDDAEMDTNYPIVEFIDRTGSYHFARTTNWSSTGVQTGSMLQSVQFTAPSDITDGTYLVRVVASGVASAPTLDVLMDSSINNVTLTIDPNDSSLYDVYNNGVLLSQWKINSFKNIDVTMEGTPGTVNIQSTPSGSTTNVYAAGESTINVGYKGSLQGIGGAVNLENDPAYNIITIDDSADTTGRTATISTINSPADSKNNGDPYGQLSGLGQAPITWEYDDTTSITIKGGTGGNTWSIQGIGAPTNLVAGGRDTVTVGNAGSVQGITSTLNIENPPNYSDLTIDDSADPNGRTFTVSNLGSNPSDYGETNDPWGQVLGLAPAAINFEYRDTNTVTIKSGTGSNTVNVTGTGIPLNLDGASGFLNATIGNAGSLQGINSPVNVYNSSSSGSSYLTVDDSADTTARTVSLKNGSVTGLSPATISWSPTASPTGGVTYVVINGPSAGSTYNVNSTSPLYYSTYLDTGAGNDVVNVLGTATNGGLYVFNGGGADTDTVSSLAPTLGGTLGSINGFVSVSGAGSTSLIIDDSGDSIGRNVTLSSSGVTGLGNSAPINYQAGVTAITINGSKAASTYTISATLAGATTTLNASTGNDTFDVGGGNLSNLAGALVINGAGGKDSATIDDSSDSSTTTYTVTTTTVGATGGFGGLTYNGMSALVLKGGLAGDTINVNSTAAGVPLTIYGGPGANTATIGNGSLNSIAGAVTYNGGGSDSVTLNDSSKTGNQTYTINPTTVSRAGVPVFAFNGVALMTLNGGSGTNIYNVVGTAAATPIILNGGASNDTFNLSPGSVKNLDAILGTVTVNGNSGSNTVNVYDQNSSAAHTYHLTATSSLTRDGTTILSYNTTIKKLSFTGSSGNNAFYADAAPLISTTANLGSSGNNTLYGPNANTAWQIKSANGGVLSKMSFSNAQNLVGGTGNDTFQFYGTSTTSGSISGTINGGGGSDTLSYSNYATSGVIVDLPLASATAVNGGAGNGISNIENVTGSKHGGDILVGDGNANRLNSVAGHNLLIGGSGGGDTLTSGGTGDILIAGTTNYDTNLSALQYILNEWAKVTASTYAATIAAIENSSTDPLNASTVTDSGSPDKADTLNGKSGKTAVADWYFAHISGSTPLDVIHNQHTGETVTAI